MKREALRTLLLSTRLKFADNFYIFRNLLVDVPQNKYDQNLNIDDIQEIPEHNISNPNFPAMHAVILATVLFVGNNPLQFNSLSDV
eukprot:UN19837